MMRLVVFMVAMIYAALVPAQETEGTFDIVITMTYCAPGQATCEGEEITLLHLNHQPPEVAIQLQRLVSDLMETSAQSYEDRLNYLRSNVAQ